MTARTPFSFACGGTPIVRILEFAERRVVLRQGVFHLPDARQKPLALVARFRINVESPTLPVLISGRYGAVRIPLVPVVAVLECRQRFIVQSHAMLVGQKDDIAGIGVPVVEDLAGRIVGSRRDRRQKPRLI